MNIFVASTSKHKVDAVKNVSQKIFVNEEVHVAGQKAASGINEQPVGNEETLLGAMNRLEALKKIIGTTVYDLLVSFENGVILVQVGGTEKWFDLGWVFVEDKSGKQGIAHSIGIEFDAQYVQEAHEKGFETTTVGSVIAAHTGADSTDPHSYLTNGALSRSQMLSDSYRAALGQVLRREKSEVYGVLLSSSFPVQKSP